MNDIQIVKRRDRAFILANTEKGIQFLVAEMNAPFGINYGIEPSAHINSEFVDEFAKQLEDDFDLTVEVIG